MSITKEVLELANLIASLRFQCPPVMFAEKLIEAGYHKHTQNIKLINDQKRGDRIYNGPPSKLMNDVYDGLIARDDTFINTDWWAQFSITLARALGVLDYECSSDATIVEGWCSKAKYQRTGAIKHDVFITPKIFRECHSYVNDIKVRVTFEIVSEETKISD